ncbi:L,D-transpeptidase family protein [Aurantiacibacter sp. D1-12]|uniref:L,D-transpeptidase family protein n=1 Tax=Aurantiacibacter sp. D1-12 TaxID=2993658 RepID=UPI00237D2064|nr:L,D-transpeptidase family protein [Aurantiacibacter sp. D1-12]MDE1467199.1 L,D-transpeptidase family protein [Aurantiacibacter sp. D1-12]
MRFVGLSGALATVAVMAAPGMAQTLFAQDILESDDAAEVTATPGLQSNEIVQEDPRFAAVQHWSIDNANALLAVIEGIGAEGLDPADYRPDLLREEIANGESTALNIRASGVFVWLVEDLRDGRTPMESRRQWFVVDPDPDLMPTGSLMTEALENGDVAGVVASLAPDHADYAALREALANTPEEATDRRRIIRANMDRWRWLPRDLGGQYLITNVPEYQLRLMVNDRIISTYRTIVGAPGRTATPQLAETVEGVVFNPTWTVPQSIVRGEGLGNRVLNNPQWARSQGYTATRGANGWISVVQQPGPTNSLGEMKLDMPNAHAIFLHDTPQRHLFDSSNRARSHGCIRVERALELAMTVAILGGGATRQEAVDIHVSGDYTRVPVQRTMPVYITYFTMGLDSEGNLRSYEDIYGRDAPVLASLDEPRQGNRARATSEEVIEIVEDARTTAS